jgi:hypothetical protein
MNREQRLQAIARIDASMPSDYEGNPSDQEIAILDKIVAENLTSVEETK